MLAGDQHPGRDSIAAFCEQHLGALAELFTQVFQRCQEAGLVKLGHIAIHGTKLEANASKHKAMSYERMGEAEKNLEAEVQKLLAEAERIVAEEDAQHGKGRRGDELPKELRRREARLRKIREAKAALEQEPMEGAWLAASVTTRLRGRARRAPLHRADVRPARPVPLPEPSGNARGTTNGGRSNAHTLAPPSSPPLERRSRP